MHRDIAREQKGCDYRHQYRASVTLCGRAVETRLLNALPINRGQAWQQLMHRDSALEKRNVVTIGSGTNVTLSGSCGESPPERSPNQPRPGVSADTLHVKKEML